MRESKVFQCSQCGASLDISREKYSLEVKCDYCDADNFLSYDFQNDKLLFTKNIIDKKEMERDLEKRIEILCSNLNSIDPLDKWEGANPTLNFSSLVPAIILASIGTIICYISMMNGVFILLLGIVLGCYTISKHSEIKQYYERDAEISFRNKDLINDLKNELDDYLTIKDQLHK